MGRRQKMKRKNIGTRKIKLERKRKTKIAIVTAIVIKTQRKTVADRAIAAGAMTTRRKKRRTIDTVAAVATTIPAMRKKKAEVKIKARGKIRTKSRKGSNICLLLFVFAC